MPRFTPPRHHTIVPPLAVLAAVAGMAACGGTDPYAPIASFDTQLTPFVVYPLSTASPLLPTAISLSQSVAVRPAVRTNLSLNFDVALDLDATGKVRLLPPKLVVAPQAGGSLVTGFQVLTNTTFDALSRAPNTGYQFDSATVVSPGQLVVVQTQGAGVLSAVCSPSTPMYAKLVIDSVPLVPGTGARAIYLKARIDPNCGFRSLDPGIPKN